MTDAPPTATTLLVGALADLRAAAGLLRAADLALADAPTDLSNVRWAVKLFVFRKRKAAADAPELFWSNLDEAQRLCQASDAALQQLFTSHGDLPEVVGLRTELDEAGYGTILPALDVRAEPGDELETSASLRPTVARMRVCEPRMVSAIQALATR